MRSFTCTEDKVMAYSLCGVLAAIPFLFFIFALVKSQPMSGGFLLYSAMSVVLVVFGAAFFIDTSELVVDETGLARRIGDRVCMHVPWNEIKCMREILRPKVRNGPRIVIQAIPSVRRGALLRLRRTLVLSEQFEDFNELIEILNAKIARYSIAVELSDNGIWAQRSRLRSDL